LAVASACRLKWRTKVVAIGEAEAAQIGGAQEIQLVSLARLFELMAAVYCRL
jgi:hypothetical protein